MFSVSPAEIATIVLVALIVFGPKRLPEIARKAGKIASQVRATADEFKSELGGTYQETVEPFREAATELAAAGKSVKETAKGELKWVDDELREAVTGGTEAETDAAAEVAKNPKDATDTGPIAEADPEPNPEPNPEPGQDT